MKTYKFYLLIAFLVTALLVVPGVAAFIWGVICGAFSFVAAVFYSALVMFAFFFFFSLLSTLLVRLFTYVGKSKSTAEAEGFGTYEARS